MKIQDFFKSPSLSTALPTLQDALCRYLTAKAQGNAFGALEAEADAVSALQFTLEEPKTVEAFYETAHVVLRKLTLASGWVKEKALLELEDVDISQDQMRILVDQFLEFIRASINRIKQGRFPGGDVHFNTVSQMASLIPPGLKARAVGKRLTKISEANNLPVREAENEVYGHAHAYHEEAWSLFFKEVCPSGGHV